MAAQDQDDTTRTRTVFWADGGLRMIDQRRLPTEFTLLDCAGVEETFAAIREMAVRGAPAIGAAGAFGMALAAQAAEAAGEPVGAALAAAKARLDDARPTAVNLSWATARMLALPEPQQTAAGVLAAAQALADEDVEINSRMGRFGAEVVPQGANILHHCNTGALATVDVGTAIGVIYEAHRQNKGVHVWVDETRPRLQGARLSAWELMREGVPMHLVADNAAGLLMLRGRVDIVLFGADRVAANGDVANKIGSYKLAVVARENGIPVYPVVPTSTIDLALAHGDEIPIEERADEEVTFFGERRTAPEGCPVYNPAFDVTPHRYVTGIITEEGIAYPPFEVSLRKMVELAEARRQG